MASDWLATVLPANQMPGLEIFVNEISKKKQGPGCLDRTDQVYVEFRYNYRGRQRGHPAGHSTTMTLYCESKAINGFCILLFGPQWVFSIMHCWYP